VRPCQLGDGIRVLRPAEEPWLLARFAAAAAAGRLSKFVPASGAASRMFEPLLAGLARLESGEEPSPEVVRFLAELESFAFGGELAATAGDPRACLRHLLTPEGLDFAALPKGLIPFHLTSQGGVTPFEEHLVDATFYTRDRDGVCRLHVTVPPAFEARFRELLERVRPGLEAEYDVRFQVAFSSQHPATDTLAVDLDDQPFRDEDGRLLFRPGGHGALLANLQETGGDLVFVRNIDNVVPASRKAETVAWRRLLAGFLALLQERAFAHLTRLDSPAPEPVLAEAERFLRQELGAPLPEAPSVEALRQRLDRPLRVCGVVRNQGQPGGGPFWVESAHGEVSAQIVEASQIDAGSPEQQAQLAASTHFNPVDLVCALRDRRGEPYELERFVDPATVFIAPKSYGGRPLAGWNTVFVEIPDATFAPVKTVLDLLGPAHR
jgi:hypothetical protein